MAKQKMTSARARILRLATDDPDIPLSIIDDILAAQAESKACRARR